MAAFPGIGNSQVKTRILNGVDPKPGLLGLTVSGGRISALRSLFIPGAPSGLGARAVSMSQVNLSWTDNSGSAAAPWTEEDGFSVLRKLQGGTAYTRIGSVAGSAGAGNTISFTDRSVAAGQIYYYKVKAHNWYGESESTSESTTLTFGGDFGLTGSSDGGGGGCFIATAAYGSPYARSIDLLRAFRDEYLMAHPIGKKWVNLYYQYSPTVAHIIADHSAMRKGVRLILFPFVAFSAGTVHTTVLQKGLIFCFIGGFLLGVAVLSKRRIFNGHVLTR
jgi:hypothetical protein